MMTEVKTLPQSRLQYSVGFDEKEVAGYFATALTRLGRAVKVSGFRPGKAPANLIRDQLKPDSLREEASTLAVQATWREVIKQLRAVPISDPDVTIEKFAEDDTGQIIFEFDIRPTVKVGSWQKIKIKSTADSEVTDEDVTKLINSLSQAHAAMVIKLGPAKPGDKMEVEFEGAIGGVRKDKLSAQHFPLILGQGTTIPGFDAHLTGLKKGQTKTFALTFPSDHFDKELAGQEADFKVIVEEVFDVILPELDKEFAERFGHKTPEQLKKAIRKDLVRQRSEEHYVGQKAQWLAEFEKLISVELPNSLVQAEVERSKIAWRKFLQERHLNEADWLKSRNVTLEQLEKDWYKAAESSVRIGLGLSEVAKESKKELKSNEEFQALLDELVRKAIIVKG